MLINCGFSVSTPEQPEDDRPVTLLPVLSGQDRLQEPGPVGGVHTVGQQQVSCHIVILISRAKSNQTTRKLSVKNQGDLFADSS